MFLPAHSELHDEFCVVGQEFLAIAENFVEQFRGMVLVFAASICFTRDGENTQTRLPGLNDGSWCIGWSLRQLRWREYPDTDKSCSCFLVLKRKLAYKASGLD